MKEYVADALREKLERELIEAFRLEARPHINRNRRVFPNQSRTILPVFVHDCYLPADLAKIVCEMVRKHYGYGQSRSFNYERLSVEPYSGRTDSRLFAILVWGLQ
jgi:hypothetical protein